VALLPALTSLIGLRRRAQPTPTQGSGLVPTLAPTSRAFPRARFHHLTGTKPVTVNSPAPRQFDFMDHHDLLLAAAVDQAMAAARSTMPQATAVRVYTILRLNYRQGRVHLFLEGRDAPTVQDYVSLVVRTHHELATYLHDLQMCRSKRLILPLYEQLQRWAYHHLLEKCHAPGMATFKGAEKCARNALPAIMAARFPYDTEFESWALIRLRQACRDAGAGHNYRLGPLPLVG
jgi:hypothetical protein